MDVCDGTCKYLQRQKQSTYELSVLKSVKEKKLLKLKHMRPVMMSPKPCCFSHSNWKLLRKKCCHEILETGSFRKRAGNSYYVYSIACQWHNSWILMRYNHHRLHNLWLTASVIDFREVIRMHFFFFFSLLGASKFYVSFLFPPLSWSFVQFEAHMLRLAVFVLNFSMFCLLTKPSR